MWWYLLWSNLCYLFWCGLSHTHTHSFCVVIFYAGMCMCGWACACDCAFVWVKRKKGSFVEIRFVVFIHLQHFTTFILFHAFYSLSYGKNISSRIFHSDSELYESFGKWNPLVAFLMWLPNRNSHIVYMMLKWYCRIYTQTHRRYALLTHIKTVYFIRVCVWVRL